MTTLIYLGMAIFLTVSIGWFNPDPCPHKLGSGTDSALVIRDCELASVGGMGRQWVKKEIE